VLGQSHSPLPQVDQFSEIHLYWRRRRTLLSAKARLFPTHHNSSKGLQHIKRCRHHSLSKDKPIKHYHRHNYRLHHKCSNPRQSRILACKEVRLWPSSQDTTGSTRSIRHQDARRGCFDRLRRACDTHDGHFCVDSRAWWTDLQSHTHTMAASCYMVVFARSNRNGDRDQKSS
jgi:hypothetical protein